MMSVSYDNSNRDFGAAMGMVRADRIASCLIISLLLVSVTLFSFGRLFLANMCGVSVCSFALSLDLLYCCVTVCSFTGVDLAERGVIVCAFTLPEILEQGC